MNLKSRIKNVYNFNINSKLSSTHLKTHYFILDFKIFKQAFEKSLCIEYTTT